MASSRITGTNEQISTYGAAGRNYTSLQAWEDATDNDLVTAAQSQVLECYRDSASFSDSVTVAGATTNASYFRIIRPAAGNGHNGTPNSGVQFTSAPVASGSTIIGTEAFFNVQDLVIITSGNTTGDVNGINFFTAGSQRAIGCILKTTNISTGEGRGATQSAPVASHAIVNCLAYDCKSIGFRSNIPAATTHRIFNCTAINCAVGFDMAQGSGTGGSVILINCLAQGNATADFRDAGGTYTKDVSYCASGDATSDDWGGVGNRISQTFTFRNTTNKDYHLTFADAGARDYGRDLSSVGTFPFNDDIDKQVRTGSWDIGFDEVNASGAGMRYASD